MINDDNPYDPIPSEAEIERMTDRMLDDHINLHHGDAIRIAIQVLGIVTGKKRLSDREIVEILKSNALAKARMIICFDKPKYHQKKSFWFMLRQDLIDFREKTEKGFGEMMDEIEYDAYLDFASKILDGITSGKIKVSDLDLYKMALDYVSHDPRLASYNKETTAKKFTKEFFGN